MNRVSNLRCAAVLLLIFFFPQFVAGQKQNDAGEKLIADFMERYTEREESTVDYSDLQDQLEYYLEHKIDLNKAGRSELERLFFLTERDINALLSHRKEFGDYITVYELQTIEALDEKTVTLLALFVTADGLNDDHTPLLQCIAKGKHEIIALHENDFQKRAGYDERLQEQGKSYYMGSPYRYALRYRFSYGSKLSFGFVGEKDMGERFLLDKTQQGFDFTSAHFFMRNIGHWKAIAIGDYQAAFGQGLTFGSGQSAGKSAYVLNVRRNFQSLRAYRSLNENEFLRGAAATYYVKRFEFTLIGSYKYISTNYQSDDSTGAFSSIQVSGLHRTQTEMQSRSNILQQIYGCNAGYKQEQFEAGITVVSTMYDKMLQPGSKPYQLYNFGGKQLTNAGVHYQFRLRNANVFGETATSNQKAFATITGVMLPLHHKLDMVFLYRKYSPDYQTTFNGAFGENRDANNEEGLYCGLTLKFSKRWSLCMYADQYRSGWLRYLVDAPSRGMDYLAEIQYSPNKQTLFYIRYHAEHKNKNQSEITTPTDYIILTEKEQYRAHVQYIITENLTGKSRLEIVKYNNDVTATHQGSVVFQDLKYEHPGKKIAVAARVAVFSVDDYNARVYATEQDVLYQYSVPLFQNSGIRFYALAHVRFRRKVDVWIKYSHTEYSNVESISSGLEKIGGNIQSDLRVQVRVVL